MSSWARRNLLASCAVGALMVGLAGPASAGGSHTIVGWPRCVVTKAQAARLGMPKTRRGEVCATPLKSRATPGGVELTRTQWRTESWEMLGLVVDGSNRIVADLVRRPR